MTASRSKPFFDLKEAVRLSRRLSAETLEEKAPHRTSHERLRLEVEPSTVIKTLPEPAIGAASNATELWRTLLDWVRSVTEAEGVFALDHRGLLVAAAGNLDPFAPEVFSEAFAAATLLFDTYLSDAQAISGVSLTFESIGRVELFPLKIGDMSILLGMTAAGPIAREIISNVCHRISGEVSIFDQNTEPFKEDAERFAPAKESP